MFRKAFGTEQLSVATVAPYAAFGAFYFLASAIWLTVNDGAPALDNSDEIARHFA